MSEAAIRRLPFRAGSLLLLFPPLCGEHRRAIVVSVTADSAVDSADFYFHRVEMVCDTGDVLCPRLAIAMEWLNVGWFAVEVF